MDVSENVHVDNLQSMAEASPALCFAFSNLSFLFWGGILGWFGEHATLMLGLVQLGVFACYHLCSQDLLVRGDGWNGNIFMIFASMFAGCGGLTNVASALCSFGGMPFSPLVPGVLWLSSGVLLLVLCPGVAKGPAAGFLFYAFGGTGLTIQGLATLGLVPSAGCMDVAAWCFFAAGCLGMLVCVSTFYGFNGTRVPLGKPLFK